MNLILDKWLDVINVNNEVETVSLLELFENIKHYVSLSGAWPQKVSMCNLLFTIAQSALSGKLQGEEDKNSIYFEEYTNAIVEYLKRDDIIGSFDFYSKNFFYNFDSSSFAVHDYKDAKGEALSSEVSWKKIFFSQCSYGNNHMAWDFFMDRDITTKEKIYELILYMFFDPGKGNTYCRAEKGKCKYRDDKMSYSHCGRNEVITYLEGSNLYQTIWLNLLTTDKLEGKSSIGLPLWEKKPSSHKDEESLENAQSTILGLKMPLASFFSYDEEGSINYDLVPVVRYNPEFSYLYPHKTAKINKKNEVSYLGHDSKKHFMRDFSLIVPVKNTPILLQMLRAFNLSDKNGEFLFDSIKIVCGAWDINFNSGIVKRKGFSEFTSSFYRTISDHNPERYDLDFVEHYNQCIDIAERIRVTSIKEYISNVKKIDSKIIEKLINNFWLLMEKEYYFLVKFCQINNEEFNGQIKTWKDKVVKMWEDSIESFINKESSQGRKKAVNLQKAVRILVYAKPRKRGNDDNGGNNKSKKKQNIGIPRSEEYCGEVLATCEKGV